jgi:hypothetical protein
MSEFLLDLLQLAGAVAVVVGASWALGGLLYVADYVWPGFVERSGDRLWGDAWRNR